MYPTILTRMLSIFTRIFPYIPVFTRILPYSHVSSHVYTYLTNHHIFPYSYVSYHIYTYLTISSHTHTYLTIFTRISRYLPIFIRISPYHIESLYFIIPSNTFLYLTISYNIFVATRLLHCKLVSGRMPEIAKNIHCCCFCCTNAHILHFHIHLKYLQLPKAEIRRYKYKHVMATLLTPKLPQTMVKN